MEPCEQENGLEDLLSVLDTVSTDKLKRRGYSRYVEQIVETARKSLSGDGSRLTILIQYIKNYSGPCFQRDVLIDVLNRLVTSPDLKMILEKPFPTSKDQHNGDFLAVKLTAIPDLIANCKSLEKYPSLGQQKFYELLTQGLYDALGSLAQSSAITKDTHTLFYLKIIGRVAMSGHKDLIWKLTNRAMDEPEEHVKQLFFELIRMPSSPRPELLPYGMYMENLYLPIFFNLKPSITSGQTLRSILGESVITNEQLRYIICDKSIFRANYNLTKERQAQILFNIASYLSSLVTQQPSLDVDDKRGKQDSSLLMVTLLEIVRSWTSSTKILVRTYHHSKYITCALLVFMRHAMRYDGKSLVKHANEVQTMIARSLPTYLNRASRQERNLSTCLAKLVLPKLRDLVIGNERQIAKIGENEELKLDFNIDLDDDLLYLQQLFQQDVGVLFQDLKDTEPLPSNSATTRPACLEVDVDAHSNQRPCPLVDAHDGCRNDGESTSARSSNDKQLGRGKKSLVERASSDCSAACSRPGASLVIELKDQHCASEAEPGDVSDEDEYDDDLKPYKIDELAPSVGDSDDDEFALGEDATNVPIYLRDCIDGLVENNNRLYVRLCLIKAGVLIDDLIDQDAADAQRLQVGASNQARGSHRELATRSLDNFGFATPKRQVNNTIMDVGVELARALLFLDNQFNIEKFNEYRIDSLISLCVAAPDLVARYLIDEFNGQSRSMQQQLDILHVLVAAAHQLATGSRREKIQATPKAQAASSVVVAPQLRKINRFAPCAPMFFYGIVYRLKADFVDAGSLIISQPKSIMSAFRAHNEVSRSALVADNSSQAEIIIKRAITQESRGQKPPAAVETTTKSRPNAEGDLEKFLETNSISDDSFLLSRIFVSIANIITCSAQQVVTCKLSEDLLNILSAYRCHPDSGVQRAMVNCLRTIRECTPRTYYEEYIEKRMMHLFGAWLAKTDESNM